MCVPQCVYVTQCVCVTVSGLSVSVNNKYISQFGVSFFLGVEYVHFATLKITGPPVIILKPFYFKSLSHLL